MRYTAHLQAGGTIEMVVKGGFTPLNLNGQSGWVMDDNGTMVNMQHVVALVPELDEPEPGEKVSNLPDFVIDGDGDRWVRYPKGYRVAPTSVGLTIGQIREAFGFADDDTY